MRRGRANQAEVQVADTKGPFDIYLTVT